MITLNIPKISCGHCARAVTEAVKALDPGAQVNVDIASKTVAIDTSADPASVNAKLVEAGYPPSAG